MYKHSVELDYEKFTIIRELIKCFYTVIIPIN